MRGYTRIPALPVLLALCMMPASAQLSLVERPTMTAQRLSAAPILNGDVLGDRAWEGVVPAEGFWQTRPSDGRPSTQPTEVFVGYTDYALYIGVVAHDDEPTEIIVTDTRRDSSLDDTDAFLVVIDGLLDRQNAYVFGTSPSGIEYDGQVTGDGTGAGAGFDGGGMNLNWDGSWSVATSSGDYGWSAEFEIPFSTLRYGTAETQEWGINFQRNIRRNNEIAYWSPLDRNRNLYRVSEAGILTGIEPPSQRNLKFTP